MPHDMQCPLAQTIDLAVPGQQGLYRRRSFRRHRDRRGDLSRQDPERIAAVLEIDADPRVVLPNIPAKGFRMVEQFL